MGPLGGVEVQEAVHPFSQIEDLENETRKCEDSDN